MAAWTARALHALRRGLALLLAGAAAAAGAQSLESVLRPGDLVHSHAKWEEDCTKCHVRFDRAAQDRLCTDCHKDVGQDMRERTGWHGRQKPQACRGCHTDHKGRGARIAEFDRTRFDHALTDYVLHGRHAKVACESCHAPGRKWSQAPGTCAACHRADDVHKGSLGSQCADCHVADGWKQARFDHGRTRFALTGRHADAACADCHRKGEDHKAAPRDCVGCHRSDDQAPRGHQGRFGEKCESCHGSKAWKPSTFLHDRDTKFDLLGRHRQAKCGDCHTGTLHREKPATDCHACHRKDDEGARGHKGSLGRDCAACHSERGWKEKGRFDHDRTRFPLLGRHVDAKCGDCHRSANHREAPRACIGCHRPDDRHEATLGTDCAACHTERDWKNAARFDHDATRFRLRNAHAAKTVACKACHADAKQFRATPTDCAACHRKDDRHEGQLGTACASCHADRDWKVPGFDHRQARFALVGRHVAVACKDCHAGPRFRDAPRECVACHRKDDRHAARFGTDCAACHTARAWGLWDYDHARRARFALDGRHARLACNQCHTRPAPPGKAAAELGSTCIACHRRDDRHDGSFGPLCEQCHVSDGWKRVRTRTGGGAAAVLGVASRLAAPGGGAP